MDKPSPICIASSSASRWPSTQKLTPLPMPDRRAPRRDRQRDRITPFALGLDKRLACFARCFVGDGVRRSGALERGFFARQAVSPHSATDSAILRILKQQIFG